MPSPFPGIDPYLETADLWSDFHHRLIYLAATQLPPLLPDRYAARIEKGFRGTG